MKLPDETKTLNDVLEGLRDVRAEISKLLSGDPLETILPDYIVLLQTQGELYQGIYEWIRAHEYHAGIEPKEQQDETGFFPCSDGAQLLYEYFRDCLTSREAGARFKFLDYGRKMIELNGVDTVAVEIGTK